jgi:hypothetical protein
MLLFEGEGGLVEALGLNQEPSPACKSIFITALNNTHAHTRFVAPCLIFHLTRRFKASRLKLVERSIGIRTGLEASRSGALTAFHHSACE